jgi:hypothetical protein
MHMNKKYIITAITAIAVLLVGVLIFGNDGAYIKTLDNQVAELEADLADSETLIADGELTAEVATAVYGKITARLESIDAAIAASQEDASLSRSQKERLVATLERLKTALNTYRDTLTMIENTADLDTTSAEAGDEPVEDADDGDTSTRRELYPGSITIRFEAAIETIEDHIDEVIEDEELEELVDEETFDDITEPDTASSTTDDSEETAADDNAADDSDEDIATTSESDMFEAADESATSTN